MDEIPISKFKATCLAVLERVRATNQPIRVTRFGKPIADILPPALADRPRRRFGTGSGRILGDIISPVIDELDFEAAQDWPTNELNKDRFKSQRQSWKPEEDEKKSRAPETKKDKSRE